MALREKAISTAYTGEEEEMSKKNLLDEIKRSATDIYEGAIINVGGVLFVVEEANVATEYLTMDCSSDWRESIITIKCHGLKEE